MMRFSFLLRRASGLLLVLYLGALALPMSQTVASVVHHPLYRAVLVLAVAHHALDAVVLAALRRRRAVARRAAAARAVLVVSALIALFHLPMILGGPALGSG